MASNEVQIVISAIDKASSKLQSISKVGKTTFKALGIAAAGVAAGLGSMTAVLVNAAQKTKIQEDAEKKLSIALENVGANVSTALPELKKFASGLQEVTTFGDESILQMQSLLVSLGDLSGEGLKDATKSTLDLAQGLGVNLRTAALLMGKAAAGETATLSRYGLVIEKGETKAETFAAVLKAVNEKFGGAAQKAALTYSGRVKQLNNKFGDLQEELGKVLTESGAVKAIQASLIKIFDKLSKKLVENKDKYLELFKSGILLVIKGMANFAKVARLVGRMFELLASGLSKTFSVILASIEKLLIGFAKVAAFTGFSSMASKANNLANKIGDISENFNQAASDIFENGSWITDTLDTIITTTESLAEAVNSASAKTAENLLLPDPAQAQEQMQEFEDILVEFADRRLEMLQTNTELEKEIITSRYDYELERLAGLEERVNLATANMTNFGLITDQQKRLVLEKRDKKQEKEEKKQGDKRKKETKEEASRFIKWDSAKRAVFADTMGRASVMMNDLASLTGKKTKEMFALQKAAAIAQAIINIEEAATKAWAQGGIWGAVLAGIVIAAGAVHIAAIAAQKMAKGGIVTQPTLALIGEAGPEKVVPLSRDEDEFDNEKQQIIINFNGPVLGDEEQAKELALAIDEELYNLKVQGQSLAFEEV